MIPKRATDKLAACYATCAAMSASPIAGRKELGLKLHTLLPRLVLGPLGGLTGEKAAAALRRRCNLFTEGH